MQHKHTVLLACACAVAALAGATALQADPGPQPPVTTTTETTTATTTTAAPAADYDLIERLVLRHRREAWRWERIMGLPLTRALPRRVDPVRRAAAWHQLAVTMRRRAQNVPHKTAWLCIHRFEGSWTDAGPPYYGGLQMDLGFMRTYGAGLLRRKGTADHWTPLEQMWTAERARRAGRGFWPWPNTARICGLI